MANDPASMSHRRSPLARMRIFLLLLCALSFLAGMLVFADAKYANHEFEGSILFLIAAVFLVEAATIEAIDRLLKTEHEAMNAMREIAKALQWIVNNWKRKVASRRLSSSRPSNPVRCGQRTF